jgi:hypothetical protein
MRTEASASITLKYDAVISFNGSFNFAVYIVRNISSFLFTFNQVPLFYKIITRPAYLKFYGIIMTVCLSPT